MKVNTNSWNKIRYTLYTPIYDIIGKVFNASRKKSIDSLEIKAGERVLLIGAGTGLDLEFLPENCVITATDITASMLDKAKMRNEKLKREITFIQMDGQSLKFETGTFDKVVLHLILAVIPNPVACIQEAERVLKIGGRIAVFDKFVKTNSKPGVVRKFLNVFTNLLFSDITRDFESIHSQSSLKIISDREADLNGNFRLILLEK